MPLLGSPFTSVPPGIARPASVPAMPPGGPGPGVGMPGGMMGGMGGRPPMMGGPQQEVDIFTRVANMMMSAPQIWLLVLAGMGLREALEKASKTFTKPHRSNEELVQQGFPMGMPGQTGLPSPGQMVASTMPPRPPGMPGFPG